MHEKLVAARFCYQQHRLFHQQRSHQEKRELGSKTLHQDWYDNKNEVQQGTSGMSSRKSYCMYIE